MQLEELLYHLHHPDTLDQYNDDTLKSLILQYPYLESLKSAYFKKRGLHSNHHQDQFEKMSDLVTIQYEEGLNGSSLAPTVFDLNKEKLSSKVELGEIETTEKIETIPFAVDETIVTYTPWYEYQHSDFIQYLSSLPACTIQPNPDPPHNTEQHKKYDVTAEEISPELLRTNELISTSLDLKNDIASESLALLWANQGQPEMAIKIYEKLIIENPENSAIFAAKIAKLKTDYSL